MNTGEKKVRSSCQVLSLIFPRNNDTCVVFLLRLWASIHFLQNPAENAKEKDKEEKKEKEKDKEKDKARTMTITSPKPAARKEVRFPPPPPPPRNTPR
jgi:hypothetical protein